MLLLFADDPKYQHVYDAAKGTDDIAGSMAKFNAVEQLLFIAACGEFRREDSIPLLEMVLAETGRGTSDRKSAALIAIRKISPNSVGVKRILPHLSDRNQEVAETAALELEFCADLEARPLLETWLHERLKKSRTAKQGRITATLMTIVIRLGHDGDALRDALKASKFTELEEMALEETWRGNIASGDPVFITWPA